MALTGTFDDLDFAELLQMLNVGNKTGRLAVSRAGETAVFHLHRGEVVRATSRRDQGPELVYKVLGWKTGEFSFERADAPVVRNIRESTEALILEGVKRFDEWERVEEDLPDMHVVLRQRAFAVNQRFDELSAEAQTVLRLVDAQRTVATIVRESGLEPMAAVKAMAELLSEGVVEEWSGPRQSGDVISAAGQLPEVSGGIEVSPHTLSGPRPSGERSSQVTVASSEACDSG